MNFEKYTQFTLQDFLADDDFIQWVINPGEENNAFWQSFIKAVPQKKDIIQKAAETIQQYRSQDNFYNEDHKALLWQRIESSIAKQPVEHTSKKVFSLPAFMRVAAAIIIIAGLSFWMISRNTSPKQYSFSTAFGEVKTITLPDQSQVTLNGNSSISYATSWKKNTVREVWIKGEGYFNVTHLNKDSMRIKSAERFIVHCGDVNIEVLGTTFNVKARHGKTNVALITGKIRIDYADLAAGSKAVIMVPGDYVEYNAKKLLVNKRLAKPAQVSTWKENEIIFTDASLKEIAETLQDNYGYTVDVKDSRLLSLKIEGDISVNNVTDLLDVLSTSLNITIHQSAGKQITISK
ncbi:MAG TPA: FecR domain-containing protein [Chitinophagaceae bacterium]|nr:FecR domain-containing protein [Chitinophagaceae bacterium]